MPKFAIRSSSSGSERNGSASRRRGVGSVGQRVRRAAATSKPPAAEPKLTDAERHRRFVDMAKEVEASEDPKDFEKAFKRVATPPRSKKDEPSN